MTDRPEPKHFYSPEQIEAIIAACPDGLPEGPIDRKQADPLAKSAIPSEIVSYIADRRIALVEGLEEAAAWYVNSQAWADGRAVLLQVPDGVPAEWVQGVANLLAMTPHPDWPEAGWKILQEDALAFLRDWAAQAHALGWEALDLFGVHAEAPHARLDGMGLVPLLSGRPVVALTEDSAAIKANSGGTLTFRRHRAWPPGRCLIWEL